MAAFYYYLRYFVNLMISVYTISKAKRDCRDRLPSINKETSIVFLKFDGLSDSNDCVILCVIECVHVILAITPQI